MRSDSTAKWRDLATFPYGEKGNLVDFCIDGAEHQQQGREEEEVVTGCILTWLTMRSICCSLYKTSVCTTIPEEATTTTTEERDVEADCIV